MIPLIGHQLDYAITIDVDWAPDWMVDLTAEILIARRARATWFITHASPAIERLRNFPTLFELGVHPNCLPGCTHGKSESEVLRHVMALVPDAVSMRTHALYQSSPWLFRAADEAGIRIDLSLFLPRASHLQPHTLTWGETVLWRLPYFWEDDFEMLERKPVWRPDDLSLHQPGLKIFDFHPVHVVLNSHRLSDYHALKALGIPDNWSPEAVEPYIQPGEGPRTMLENLAERVPGGGSLVRDIARTAEARIGGECA